MKRLVKEEDESINPAPILGGTEVWDEQDVFRVEEPEVGGPPLPDGSGGSNPGGPRIHWPDPIIAPPPPPGAMPGEENKDDVNIITDPEKLTDEEKQKIEDELLGGKDDKFDKHIEVNTSPETNQAPLTDEQKEQLKREIGRIKKKAREDEKNANKGIGLSDKWGRQDTAITIHRTETDWRNILRNFFKPYLANRTRQTYTEPNRRQLQTDQGTPEVIFQGEEEVSPNMNRLQIFVTVDTSGSVDDAMYASFLSEINTIFTSAICQNANVEVRVILWTGDITGDYLLHDRNFKQYFANARRSFSGDTRFDKLAPYFEKKHYKPIAVVHFTDGYIDVNKSMLYKKGGCKNIIVIPQSLTSSIQAAKKVPFDLVIPMVVYRSSGGEE